MAKPTDLAMAALKRLDRYLKGRPRMLFRMPFQECDTIDVYSDTDWAGCLRTRKSTSGGCVMLGGHALKHWSSTQATVTLSSGEAEFNGLVKGAGIALGQQALLADLGISVPVRLWTDSSAAMSTDEINRHDGPGCGVGLYAILLLIIFLVGVIGMIGGTIGLLNSEPEEARNLVHGSEVQVWRLQPMRDAELLELTEVPAAWHDESPRFDGTTACVLTQEGVGRVDGEKRWFALWEEVTDTTAVPTPEGQVAITIEVKQDSFACLFGQGEGAERFLRQISAERQRASSSDDTAG